MFSKRFSKVEIMMIEGCSFSSADVTYIFDKDFEINFCRQTECMKCRKLYFFISSQSVPFKKRAQAS